MANIPEWAKECKEWLRVRMHAPSKGNAAFNTYFKFLCNFDDLCSLAFRAELVKQSFAATGLVPFDPRKMLSTYCFYKSLINFDANAISKILEALDGPAGLVMIAAREGEVDDDSIDAALWDPLFKHVADIRYMKKKTPGMPLNHKRCLWVNNRTLIRNEFDRMERKREEERAAAEAKADKKRRREENMQAKVREQEEKRRRLEHFDAETWEPKWLGLPCQYDADGGDLLVCEAKQKTQVPHCRSAAHVSFLAAIRPREAVAIVMMRVMMGKMIQARVP
jgi:hypothetical protein